MPPNFEQKEKPAWNKEMLTLGYAILHETQNATVDYKIDGTERELAQKISPEEISTVFEKFHANPKDAQLYCVINLMAISDDTTLSEKQRLSKLERFLDAYIELVLQADHHNYPPDENIKKGIPDYIPDGLSDLGGNPKIDPRTRSREKIRVDKRKIFEQARPLFLELFAKKRSKEQMVDKVAKFVHDKMHYDYEGNALRDVGKERTVGIHEYMEEQQGVCRHHALYAQNLLQLCGLTTRLIKCDYGESASMGKHACNLVRIDGLWHLLDVTTPEYKTPRHYDVFLKPLPEKKIYVNEQTYRWTLDRDDALRGKRQVFYESRNDMYFRMRKNN